MDLKKMFWEGAGEVLIFADSKGVRYIIPVDKIHNIVSVECTVNINYDSGEMINVEGTFVKKIDSVHLVFESADAANKVLRQFYKACNAKAGAFYFGEV